MDTTPFCGGDFLVHNNPQDKDTTQNIMDQAGYGRGAQLVKKIGRAHV